MKDKITSGNLRPIFLLPAALALVFSACVKKVDTIKNTDILSLPNITAKNFESVYDDSGKVQLILKAPLLQHYENADASYAEFKYGITVVFYDGHKAPVGTVTAKYAKYTDKDKLWELRDSVVVHGNGNNMLETEQLFWDQDKDRIFTDKFVKIKSEDQIIMGSGFESDTRLNNRKIKNVQGIIYLDDE